LEWCRCSEGTNYNFRKQNIAVIFKVLKQPIHPPNEKRRMISFKQDEENE
jgi:hypothetical protein